MNRLHRLVDRGQLVNRCNERNLLPSLLQLSLDVIGSQVLNDKDPQPNHDTYSGSETEAFLRKIACDPRPLDQIIPNYDRWRIAIRDKLGCSPGHLRAGYRIEQACRYLRDPHLSIREIAGLCGFGSSSAFIRNFQQHHHCTPQKWRGNVAST